jgi:hypothetical protein
MPFPPWQAEQVTALAGISTVSAREQAAVTTADNNRMQTVKPGVLFMESLLMFFGLAGLLYKLWTFGIFVNVIDI